jgi:hypothetical protein
MSGSPGGHTLLEEDADFVSYDRNDTAHPGENYYNDNNDPVDDEDISLIPNPTHRVKIFFFFFFGLKKI